MKSCRCSTADRCDLRKRAFTLIEVVVGLVIMASVLVGSLMAHQKHQRQLAGAKAKMAAVVIADDMLQKWSINRGGVPLSGSGLIAGRPDWFWQTEFVGIAAPAGVEVKVIRLQIAQRMPTGVIRRHCSVDVVKP